MVIAATGRYNFKLAQFKVVIPSAVWKMYLSLFKDIESKNIHNKYMASSAICWMTGATEKPSGLSFAKEVREQRARVSSKVLKYGRHKLIQPIKNILNSALVKEGFLKYRKKNFLKRNQGPKESKTGGSNCIGS